MKKIDPEKLAIHFRDLYNAASKYRSLVLLTVGACTVSIVVSSYTSYKLEQCKEVETHAAPIQILQLDEGKRKFILRHKFSGIETNFREFVENVARQNYAKKVNISLLEDAQLAKVQLRRYKIEGLFWHDRFIFDFLDGIQNLAPGFLEISQFEINRFAQNVLHSPILKLEVLCRVFQK